MFQNDLDWLAQQLRVATVHADYARPGFMAASVTFNGDGPMVRQFIDRLAALSEQGQRDRGEIPQHPKE